MSTLTIVPSDTRTSNGSQEFGGWTPDLPLVVTADVTGFDPPSGTLAIHLDHSVDGVNWVSLGALNFGGTGVITQVFERVPSTRQFRFRWVMTGSSPSMTFSVAAFSRSEGAY